MSAPPSRRALRADADARALFEDATAANLAGDAVLAARLARQALV